MPEVNRSASEALDVLSAFFPKEAWSVPCDPEPLGQGLIHSTWKCTLHSENDAPFSVILQQVNTRVFRNPEVLFNNYRHFYTLLESAGFPFESHTWYLTRQKEPWAVDAEGRLWRCFSFIDGTPGSDDEPLPGQLKASAEALATFHGSFRNADTTLFREAIPGFLDLQQRLTQFYHGLEMGIPDRLSEATELVGLLRQAIPGIASFLKAWKMGAFPLQLIHGDPKGSNLLFYAGLDRVKAFVDLDTLMPGPVLYDFGDMVRSMVFGGDQPFDPSRYYLMETAYVNRASSWITESEASHLRLAVAAVVLIQALRFATDYVQGDVYYQVEHPHQNLDRAWRQWRHFSEFTREVPH
jgi:Ser/Thr protein kinase RdoA (MazF antagonist)